MALDLLGIIIEFFKINCNIIECYPNQPFEAIFYLIFFPTVFILLFIYILSNFIFRGGEMQSRGLRILVSVAIYMFIIVGGWYSLFIALSRIWWIVIILLAGLWIFVRHFTGGGGGSGAMPSATGKKQYVLSRLKKGGGQTSLENKIDDRIQTMEGIVEEIKKPKQGSDIGILINRYLTVKNETEALIDQLDSMLGWPAKEAITKKFKKKMSELTQKFKKETNLKETT